MPSILHQFYLYDYSKPYLLNRFSISPTNPDSVIAEPVWTMISLLGCPALPLDVRPPRRTGIP
jgi:hypothetical protein